MSNITVKEVLVRVQQEVGFPLSTAKVRRAGYDPSAYLKSLAKEISTCSDVEEYRKKLGKLLSLVTSLDREK